MTQNNYPCHRETNMEGGTARCMQWGFRVLQKTHGLSLAPLPISGSVHIADSLSACDCTEGVITSAAIDGFGDKPRTPCEKYLCTFSAIDCNSDTRERSRGESFKGSHEKGTRASD